MQLRVHAFQPYSRANGPGLRAVLWLQGCTLGCPGCFNPLSHPAEGGELWQVESLLERLEAAEREPEPVEGLTLSGGEPLQQLPALLELLRGLRKRTRLSVLLFSGFEWSEIQRLPGGAELPALLDILIAGRYREEERLAQGLLGSANKQAHYFTPRYTLADLKAVPPAEVWITPQGELIFSGIHPLK